MDLQQLVAMLLAMTGWEAKFLAITMWEARNTFSAAANRRSTCSYAPRNDVRGQDY